MNSIATSYRDYGDTLLNPLIDLSSPPSPTPERPMARIARFVVPGLPHHVTQRGNRRQRVFFG